MPQKIVPIIAGEIYHVFNRGVDKREIFTDKADYLRFYQSLHLFNSKEAIINFDLARARSNSVSARIDCLVEIQAYSLLSNHFHLIVKSLTDDGISEFMRRMSSGYTTYFNQRYTRSGALFQGPFKRMHIDNQERYQYLFAYVNENHFVHNMDSIREICHSSSLHYQGVAKSKLISNVSIGPYLFKENVALAKDIYSKRQNYKLKKVLFE